MSSRSATATCRRWCATRAVSRRRSIRSARSPRSPTPSSTTAAPWCACASSTTCSGSNATPPGPPGGAGAGRLPSQEAQHVAAGAWRRNPVPGRDRRGDGRLGRGRRYQGILARRVRAISRRMWSRSPTWTTRASCARSRIMPTARRSTSSSARSGCRASWSNASSRCARRRCASRTSRSPLFQSPDELVTGLLKARSECDALLAIVFLHHLACFFDQRSMAGSGDMTPASSQPACDEFRVAKRLAIQHGFEGVEVPQPKGLVYSRADFVNEYWRPTATERRLDFQYYEHDLSRLPEVVLATYPLREGVREGHRLRAERMGDLFRQSPGESEEALRALLGRPGRVVLVRSVLIESGRAALAGLFGGIQQARHSQARRARIADPDAMAQARRREDPAQARAAALHDEILRAISGSGGRAQAVRVGSGLRSASSIILCRSRSVMSRLALAAAGSSQRLSISSGSFSRS